MLSPLATLLFIWAAIHLYSAAFNLWLYGRRAASRELLAFAVVNLGTCVSTVGSALATDAGRIEEGRFALTLVLAGGTAAVPPFVEFALALSRRSRPHLRRAAYAVSLVGLALAVSGHMTTTARADGRLAFVGGPESVVPGLSPIGGVMTTLLLGLCAVGVFEIAVASRRDHDLRWLLGAACVATAAAIFDNIVRLIGVDTFRTLDHAQLLPLFAVNYLLLRRIVATIGELGERTEELERSDVELRAAQDELEREGQLAAVGELSAVIAHEVRNPLAIIKNAVSSLRRQSLVPDDRRLLLSICDEEVDRLNRLVRDLLAYARPAAPRRRAIDLAELLDEALGRSVADAPGVAVECAFVDEGTVHGDPALIRQAIESVLENAVLAMPDGGTLSVRLVDAEVEGRAAVSLEILDTGVGMDVETREKAAAPFFTTRPAGTGLGLAIVERVVRNHRGQVEIESTPGEGTRVVVRFPRERLSVLPASLGPR